MTTHQDRMDARMVLDLAVEDIETAVRKLNEYCDITGDMHLKKTFVAGLEYFIGSGGWVGHDATAESLREEMDKEQRIADEASCEICGEDDSEGGMGDMCEMVAVTDRGERIDRNVHFHCGEYHNMELSPLKSELDEADEIRTTGGNREITGIDCELCGETIGEGEMAEMAANQDGIESTPTSMIVYVCHTQCGLDRGMVIT